MTTTLVVMVTIVVTTTRALKPQQLEHFKLGFLAPWNATYDAFSALTSASAISIAIERIHSDPTLNKSMRFRFFRNLYFSFADSQEIYSSGKRRYKRKTFVQYRSVNIDFALLVCVIDFRRVHHRRFKCMQVRKRLAIAKILYPPLLVHTHCQLVDVKLLPFGSSVLQEGVQGNGQDLLVPEWTSRVIERDKQY